MAGIAELTQGLARSPDGYWSSGSAPVSYPAGGSDACFAIEDHSLWFQHRNRAILTVVKSFPPPAGGVFLDVGGGNGYVTRALQDEGFPAVLLEPGQGGARNAIARGVEHVICGTTDTVDFPDASVAAIGLFDVIEHVSDDDAFLRSLFSLLQPGGRIYISVPVMPALWSIDDVEAGHFRRYTKSGIEALLRHCGFRVDYSTSLFWLLPLPILMLRALPTRMGLRKPMTTGRLRAEHQVKGGWSHRLAAKALGLELSLLKRRMAVPTGSSCLLAGTRPGTAP